jgi:hypothetical protein
MTAAKFEPLIFSVLGLALSNAVNMTVAHYTNTALWTHKGDGTATSPFPFRLASTSGLRMRSQRRGVPHIQQTCTDSPQTPNRVDYQVGAGVEITASYRKAPRTYSTLHVSTEAL